METVEVSPTGAKVIETGGPKVMTVGAAAPAVYHCKDNNRNELGALEARLARDSWQSSFHESQQEESRFQALNASIHRDSLATQEGFRDTQRTFSTIRHDVSEAKLFNSESFALAARERCLFAGESALRDATNTAALQKSIADCCCELKEKIASSTQVVLDRVNAVEVKAQDRLLNDANAKITALTVLLNKFLPTGCGPVL